MVMVTKVTAEHGQPSGQGGLFENSVTPTKKVKGLSGSALAPIGAQPVNVPVCQSKFIHAGTGPHVQKKAGGGGGQMVPVAVN
jgi:hypothetical protein